MGGISFSLTHFVNWFSFLHPLFGKIPVKFLPSQRRKMFSLVSRTGRQLQRYDKGYRQVVGCIPYRYRSSSTNDKTFTQELEVLVISSQKGQGMQFPKGGWEIDESKEEAVLRETLEEAGVIGNVEFGLGKWHYKSKTGPIIHEVHMFPLLVKKQFDRWPEKSFRKRRWMTVTEAKEACPHWWMKEALDAFVRQQMLVQRNT